MKSKYQYNINTFTDPNNKKHAPEKAFEESNTKLVQDLLLCMKFDLF